jgi:hypothetical protein
MSQQLLDLVNRFGGSDAIAAMAARVGLSPEQTQSAMAALMPAVAGGLASHVEANGAAALDAAAAPATTVVADEGVASDAAVSHGGGLLGALFGDSAATSAVADHAAAATGIDASKLAALLPMVATLAAGALGHAGGAAAPAGGIGGMLGGLLGGASGGGGGGAASVLGSLLGGSGGTNALDGILGMMRGR